MNDRDPMYNLADTYASNMLEPLYTIIFLVGLYKGSNDRGHLKCADEWIPKLERTLESLKRELAK